MAAPTLPLASSTRQTCINTPTQFPEAQTANACPPPQPHSPPRPTPRIVPGPNAFAAKLREEAVSNLESQQSPRHRTSNGGDIYSVSMYKGMQPSPKLRGSPFETTKAKSPKSSGSYGTSDAPSSPTGNTFWQQSEPRSDFWLRLQSERARLDSNATKRASPPQQETEKLKLVPSPRAHYQPIPTHRMELDLRREQKQVQAAHPLSPSFPSTTLKAAVCTPRNRSRTPTPLQLEHSNIKSTPRSSTSPRKKFFNKIGLGGPPLKPTTPQNASPSPDPVKPNLTPLKNVPPKAARILGTASVGGRHGNMQLGNIQAPSSSDNRPDLPSEGVRRSGEAVSTRRQNTTSTDSNWSRSRYTIYGGKYKDIDDGVGMHLAIGDSPGYNEDRPPTPPSKSTLHERYVEQDTGDPRSAGISSASEQGLRHPALRNSANASDEDRPRLRRTGYVSRPHVVEPLSTPLQKVIEPDRNDTKQLPPFPGAPSPRPALRSSRSPKHGSIKPVFGVDTLPTTIYTPLHCNDHSLAAQPSPYSALSVSPSQLRPVPLNIPPHVLPHVHGEQHRSPPSSGSGSKSRDTSNGTSTSVPVYLETPSTANLRSAGLGGMPTASSVSTHPNESAMSKTSPSDGGEKVPTRNDHTTTAAGFLPEPYDTTNKVQLYGISSPTSSRPRPSYESMTTEHESAIASPRVALDRCDEYAEQAELNDDDNNDEHSDDEQQEPIPGPRDAITALVETILHDRATGLEAVEGTLRFLCAQIEALSVDVRAVLAAVRAICGREMQRRGTDSVAHGADHVQDTGGARGSSGGKDGAADPGNCRNGARGAGERKDSGGDGFGSVGVGGSGHATWGPGGVYTAQDGSMSRELPRSLPAGLGAQRKGARDYLMGLPQDKLVHNVNDAMTG